MPLNSLGIVFFNLLEFEHLFCPHLTGDTTSFASNAWVPVQAVTDRSFRNTASIRNFPTLSLKDCPLRDLKGFVHDTLDAQVPKYWA